MAKRKRATQAQVLRAASRKYRVPLWILKGVKVTETGPTGTGIGAVSSAAAKGPFQFIDSTAEAYDVNVGSFSSSAFGAAKYLAALKKEHGSWDAAIQAYSGGGYGIQTVRENARDFKSGNVMVDAPFHLPLPGPLDPGNVWEEAEGLGSGILDLFGGDGGSLSGKAGNIEDAVVGIGQFFAIATRLLFTPAGWLQVGQVSGGIVLIGWGLHRLVQASTGVDPTAVARRTATKAAEVATIVK